MNNEQPLPGEETTMTLELNVIKLRQTGAWLAGNYLSGLHGGGYIVLIWPCFDI